VRSALFASIFALGCSLGPAPGIAPPRPQRCNDLRRAILGTWVHDTTTMELRPDGAILRDGVEGSFRWTTPGHAAVDVTGVHEEHAYGLMTGAQLLDVDADGHARTWTRVSMVPAFPEHCFEVRGSLVGDWTDGTASESFLADGTYVRGETRGNWSAPEPGYVDVAVGMRVWRYRIAVASEDRMVSAIDGPSIDDDPRGGALVETRLR
jgi:hypothetical protein